MEVRTVFQSEHAKEAGSALKPGNKAMHLELRTRNLPKAGKQKT